MGAGQNLTQDDRAHLERSFRHFGEMCDGQSPLYAALSPRIAEDAEVLALLAVRPPRQPAVNLLMGAVHELLLAGAPHPLASFYPSVGGDSPPADAYPAFADFCHRFGDRITAIIPTRRVQTNEVGRCGLLLPAFAEASARFDGRPLHLIEVGCSTGLNLRFDAYTYEYRHPDDTLAHACGPPSAARVRTRLLAGPTCPLPDVMPPVIARTGVDMAPVDVDDDDAVRWVEALIWPDQLERHALFRAAVAIARARSAVEPIEILEGDGLELAPDLARSADAEALPVVFHSHATCQMDEAWRERFAARLADVGRVRDVVHLSLEWLGDEPGPQLRRWVHARGRTEAAHLADCHHHGAWLRWLDDST